MRPGTPGFVGARLREAREARSLTAIALADLVGVSRQAISQFENANVTPHPEVMQAIATSLNLPVHFFLRAVEDRGSTTVFYRSMSSATKSARIRGERRAAWLREMVAYLEGFLELPSVSIPEFSLPSNPLAMEGNFIQSLATELRKAWGLSDGPISNVVRLMENHGIVVARDQLDAATLDAFSSWHEGRPFIVLGSDKGSAVRSRLDAAHELGHVVLHRYVTPELLGAAANYRLIEDQAFQFARAFLLPETSFPNDLYVPSLDSLRSVKRKWGVSIGAMLMRATELDIVPPDHETRLWIGYSRRGWRKSEPLDDELEPERPRMLSRALEMVLNEAGQSPQEVLSSLPFADTDIEHLLGLPLGFLQGNVLPIRHLNAPSFHAGVQRRSISGNGKVIKFDKNRIRQQQD